MPNEIYKLFGPISVVVTGLAILTMLYVWRGDKSMTISQHAAAHKSSYLFMLIVQSTTLPMLFLFWSKWLAPELELPSLFTACAFFACLGLLLAAWIPDTKGWKSIVHGLVAYGAAMLAIPMTTMLYLSQGISTTVRHIALFVLIYEIAAVVMLTVLEKAKSNHLYIQAAYIFLFVLTTLAAAYIK